MSDSRDIEERLTRMEERLIAERSVRKTRDDQLFKFISDVHLDMEFQEKSLGQISSDVEDVSLTLARMEETLKHQEEAIRNVRDSRDAVIEIQGSIKTMKWMWPLIMTLIGFAISMILTNFDLKIDRKAPDNNTQQVKGVE